MKVKKYDIGGKNDPKKRKRKIKRRRLVNPGQKGSTTTPERKPATTEVLSDQEQFDRAINYPIPEHTAKSLRKLRRKNVKANRKEGREERRNIRSRTGEDSSRKSKRRDIKESRRVQGIEEHYLKNPGTRGSDFQYLINKRKEYEREKKAREEREKKARERGDFKSKASGGKVKAVKKYAKGGKHKKC